MPKEANKERLLIALIETSSIREAAKKSGIGEATIYRFLQDKEFLAEYRNARRQTVEAAISQLQNAAGAAVETLKSNLHCENPAISVRASQIILDFAFKGLETTDILLRLEEIEREHFKQIK
jgi:AcrR family transcriptional regulator